MTYWLRGGMVVDERGPYAADVVVSGTRIEALGVVRPFGAFEEIDCSGLWLLPGGVDAVDHLERSGDSGDVLALDGSQGRITPGSDADLVAVDPDALDLGGAQAVRWVLRRGERVV
jgi:dihydroorotase-like cyclic amidohydrolase